MGILKDVWKIFSLVVLTVMLFSFKTDDAYVREIKLWHEKREADLKTEQGWLNLAGLFWLEPGVNTFGADTDNKIIFPSGKSAGQLGAFILKDGQVTLEATPNAEIYAGDKPVTNMTIFPAEQQVILKHKSLRWFVIKRGEKYAVRLKDLESPFLKEFKGVDTFPVDEAWKLKAKFEPTQGRKIAILDVTGKLDEQDSPGVLVFVVKGKTYKLDALESEGKLFVIFGDKTNKKETYGAGRFVYAALPDADGFTTLDFNKSINPPCAFTPYATCPLPPKQNVLTVAIPAGEKNYEVH